MSTKPIQINTRILKSRIPSRVVRVPTPLFYYKKNLLKAKKRYSNPNVTMKGYFKKIFRLKLESTLNIKF